MNSEYYAIISITFNLEYYALLFQNNVIIYT